MSPLTEQPTPEPTHTAPEASRWWGRLARSAGTLRVAVAVAPVASSTVASVIVALLLPAPGQHLATLLWWAAVLGAGVVALLAVRRLTVRLAPLAALLDLTLVFPDEAPSRFAVARRARSVDEALDVLEDLGEASSVQAAAEASLALVIALETHDRATRGHAERVRLLADLVGQELGVTQSERVRLRWGALLHDLGKLHVHGDILNKAGRPTEDEWQQLRRHPLEGDRLVQPLRPWLGDWVNAVVEHHERFDGHGYPHGRAGTEVSLAGRIVSVVDAYETMTARRAYKQPQTAEEARRELVACAGTQFDPDIVRAFLSVSIPAPSRRNLLLGWLAQLPIVAWMGRLPRESTTAMIGAGAATATLVVSGLSPAPAPPVVDTPETTSTTALDETGDPQPSRPNSARSRDPNPSTTLADLPNDGEDRQSETRDEPGSTGPSELDNGHSETPDPSPEVPGDTDPETSRHRRATHTAASTLHLGATVTTGSRWLPLVTDRPPDRGVPDADHDGRPGISLPTASWDATHQDPPPLAWTLQVPATAIASPGAEATLHLARSDGTHMTTVLVHLVDCQTDLRSCHELAVGETTVLVGPVSSGWSEATVQLGPLGTLVEEGRVLTAMVSAPKAPNGTLLAIDTVETPSRLTGISLAPANLLNDVTTTSGQSPARSWRSR